MTKIDDMIKDLCPDGVEWKKLWEVTIWDKKFNSVPKFKQQLVDKYEYLLAKDLSQMVVSGGDIKILTTSPSNLWTTEYVAGGEFFDKEIVAIPWGGNPIVQYYKGKFITGDNRIARVKNDDELLTKYLYYYLQNNLKLISSFYRGSGIQHPDMSKVLDTKIPIPPLEIQEEVVKILDKFTDYVTELTSELTLRQKQYSFYRDKLLSFEDEIYQVEWKTLEEISVPIKNISWKENSERTYSYIDLSSVDRESKKITDITTITADKAPSRAQRIVKTDDIIFGTTRPTLRRFAKVPENFNNQICSTGFYVFRASNEVLPSYIYHIFASNDFNSYVEKNQSGASYPAIADSLVKKYKLPVPSLKIQSRIVQVLDNFDTVCNDLNIGLPKEIELRQKQYEYFRDKLLTFTAEGVYTDSTVQYRQDLIRLLQWVFGPIKVSLGSICSISRGKRLIRSQLNKNGKYPVYQNSLIPLGYFNETNEEANTTFVISAGAAGEIGFSKQPFWKADDVWTMSSEFINQRFLYYMLLSNQSKIKGQVRKASIPRLSKNVIENLTVCLPESEGQSRIVSVLDKFDTLINSISEGLPKEIELRQKQYEYFRDKLLSF
ncbi:restriction endonuclease subunit S [Streptococcus mutans]|jgi:Restriction endonuclease S subunits|uniref:Type I restriction-modification system, specificity determinant n=1 Tax=Streptococcus mutans serotype c (strain ATCC 700610 / UA159) TaxID=210007 RepID=Q8DUM6_STRMU|nr:restriction endonuclease subunit S [Streptococcus mutans]AAN58606.1 putative type I restriction-modification system, specificity determinant [Streptococcus mutans UA159]EMP58377.1 type I restriction-modification system, specificity determinant [Streptococcus mutans KK21]UVT93100.1 restriction endonuclease subunit S [Streptococcus mutans]